MVGELQNQLDRLNIKLNILAADQWNAFFILGTSSRPTQNGGLYWELHN